MPSEPIQVQLPYRFTSAHERVAIDYLNDQLYGRAAWRIAFEAFDLLHQAIFVTTAGRSTFRSLFRYLVDFKMADSYLRQLLALQDIKKQSPALWSSFARRIVSEFKQRGWLRSDMPNSRLLLSYLLYWWGSFARGYAFEAEIFRDLEQSQIQFEPHNLLDRQQRFSHSDLTINGMAGDIKTSVYFVRVGIPLGHDFYIVRLFKRRRTYTLVALLQPPTWNKINGDTVDGRLDNVITLLPAPVRIRDHGHELVVLEYEEWKRRILHQQGGTR